MTQIPESKKELFKSRQKIIEMVEDAKRVIILRCILEGCVYGYEGVHKMPELECLYCQRPKDSLKDKGVKLNDWRSPGQSVEEMIAAQKENNEKKEHDEKYKY
jgi:hypothetical protein